MTSFFLFVRFLYSPFAMLALLKERRENFIRHPEAETAAFLPQSNMKRFVDTTSISLNYLFSVFIFLCLRDAIYYSLICFVVDCCCRPLFECISVLKWESTYSTVLFPRWMYACPRQQQTNFLLLYLLLLFSFWTSRVSIRKVYSFCYTKGKATYSILLLLSSLFFFFPFPFFFT